MYVIYFRYRISLLIRYSLSAQNVLGRRRVLKSGKKRIRRKKKEKRKKKKKKSLVNLKYF